MAEVHEIRDNLLHKIVYKNGRLCPKSVLCVPACLRIELIKAHHDSEWGGCHLGRYKTLGKLARAYYWDGMRKDVHEWVKTCATCAAVKNPCRLTRIPLGQLPIPPRPMESIHTDCIGPLRLTKNRNKHIVVFIDPMSKWIEAFAVPDIKAATVAKLFMTENTL